MFNRYLSIFLFACIYLTVQPSMWGQNNTLPDNTNSKISFIENKGQWDNDIKFKFKSASLDILLNKNTISYFILDPVQIAKINSHPHQTEATSNSVSGHFIDLTFRNANKTLTPIANGEANHFYYNYFIGKNPAKWRSKVQSFQKIIYPDLYTNIDLAVSSESTSRLKFDWILKPNANINDIELDYKGSTDYKIEYGELFIYHSLGFIKEKKPFAYQFINGKKIIVEVKYVLKNSCIHFEAAEYNKQFKLIIDPDLIFSTYSGSTEDNFGFTATYDSEGNLYAGGITSGGGAGHYPVTPGAYQLTFNGGTSEGPMNLPCDITISKYSSDGKELLYATYIGGQFNEAPHSLIVDNNDNLVIMGTTKSDDYPVSSNAYNSIHMGGSDVIVTKLSKDGSTLLGSTYIGGTGNDGLNSKGTALHKFYADDFRGDVIVDKEHNIIVGSCTRSDNFPVTNNSFGGSVIPNFLKGVVFKLDSNCSKLIFSSAFQGFSHNAVHSVDLNTNGDIFIAGGTTENMGIAVAKNNFNGGVADGFFAKIKKDGSQILNARYFGTEKYDQIFGLELDINENVYIVGHTDGILSIIGNVYFTPNGKQFIAKISNDFSTIHFLSKFGSDRNTIDLTINAFLLDDCGRLYMSGWGGVNEVGNTSGLPVTGDAYKKTTDNRDFYIIVLGLNAQRLLYATFFGGDFTGDHVDGGTSRFDKKGSIYQSVCASCPDGNGGTISDFPTSSDAVFKTNVSPRCSNAAFKMQFIFKEAKIDFTIDTCASTIRFNCLTENVFSYFWQFPDGDTSDEQNPVLPIDKVNNKAVSLVINRLTPCNDSTKINVVYTADVKKVKTANVFTPNNDGLNDFFLLDGLTSPCDEAEITIYNRWGQEMYKSSSTNFKWDGKDNNGLNATEGVYFYIASFKQLNAPKKQLHGTVTLIR